MTESDAGITCVAALCFQYKKILRRLPSKWLTFCGEAYIYVRLASAKKFQYISSSFFPGSTGLPCLYPLSLMISWPSFFRIFRLKYRPIPVARLSSRRCSCVAFFEDPWKVFTWIPMPVSAMTRIAGAVFDVRFPHPPQPDFNAARSCIFQRIGKNLPDDKTKPFFIGENGRICPS